MTATVSARPVDSPAAPADLPPAGVPLWFERGLIVVCSGLVNIGGFGLLLAVVGHYSLAPALILGLIGTVLFAGLALRGSARQTERSPANAPAIVMGVLAVASALWNGKLAGHYVYVDRDPGVYATAGRWLASHGSLEVYGEKPWQPVHALVNWAGAGMYPEPGGTLEFQFNHFLPVVLAEAHGVGGDRAMFSANAVLGAIGLCMVFAVGCRLCKRPWLVLAGVAALALSLPQVLFSRDTYSEAATQALLWSALWLILAAWERRHFGLAALGGLALGGTVMTRIDALVYLGALPALAAIVWLSVGRRTDRRFVTKFVGVVVGLALPPIVLGSIDLQVRSTGYYDALKSQVSGLRLMLVASAVVGILLVAIVPRIPAAHRLLKFQTRLASVVAAVVGIGLALAWAVRPGLQHPTTAFNSTVATLQAREGLAVDGNLSYSEHSMVWFSWYLGPITVGLAVIGLALLAHAAVRGRPAALLLLATALPGTLLYLYEVSNTAEQVWVMRRFVPAGLPLFMLAAVYVVDAAATQLSLRAVPQAWVRRGVAVAGVLFVVFPLGTVLPVRNFQTQRDYLPVVDTICAKLGPNGAIAFPFGDTEGTVLSQTVRSFCNIPATRLVKGTTPASLAKIKATMQAEGRTLWIAGSTAASVRAVIAAPAPQVLGAATNNRKLEPTITRLPDRYTTQTVTVWATKA